MIKVETVQLLSKLRTNRFEHVSTVQMLKDAYAAALAVALHEQLDRLGAGQGVERNFLLAVPEPADFTLEYDRAIEQYEWEVQEHVELTREDFNRFVRDEWDWAPRWAASTQAYLGT